jgi:hypothetical protein
MRMGVAAPGLRPTASDALDPISPTARAEPTAARPMCTLPAISAMVVMFMVFVFLGLSHTQPRRLATVNCVKLVRKKYETGRSKSTRWTT